MAALRPTEDWKKQMKDQHIGTSLSGKIALITGGCSGMGLATAQRFLAAGASVIIADIQDDKGRSLAATMGKAASFVHCDVLREDDIVAAVKHAVDKFGGLDILFNNAGAVGDPGGVEGMTIEGWDRTIALLQRSTMLGIKHAIPAMRCRGGGSIINNASVTGLRPGMASLAYSVAKAGTIQLSRMSAAELAKDNIRVNCVCPGFIVTSIFGDLLAEERTVSDAMLNHLEGPFSGLQPLKRAGVPEDVAEACLYLATASSRFVTGTEIVVDGGLLVEPRVAVDPTSGHGFVDILLGARDAARSQ
jgi:NAD(P)-dependent dehydrogenase (short-subunit alcohol dehydrogenase family)